MPSLLPLKRKPARARTLLRRLFPRGGVRAQPARPLADAFVGTALGASLGATSGWAWAMLEAGLICAAALGCGLWLDPSDPFGRHAQFPWLWLAPALLAMRYGTGIGIIATLMLLVAWFGLADPDPVRIFPEQYFLGGLTLVLVCGQFSDVWNARSRRLRAVNAYLDERLNTLTKNHFLLRLSHERLEQDLLAKPLTLRETLQRLRGACDTSGFDSHGRLSGADEFIRLLGQSCQLEIAAVHGLDARGWPQPVAQAALGTPTPLDLNDPLLRYSLEQGSLAHVQGDAAPQEVRDSSRYLICAPLMPSRGTAVGLLVVEKLPFFALNDDLLKLLSVLIGYYADGVQAAAVVREVTAVVPVRAQRCCAGYLRAGAAHPARRRPRMGTGDAAPQGHPDAAAAGRNGGGGRLPATHRVGHHGAAWRGFPVGPCGAAHRASRPTRAGREPAAPGGTLCFINFPFLRSAWNWLRCFCCSGKVRALRCCCPSCCCMARPAC